jgi:hypothetical protein
MVDRHLLGDLSLAILLALPLAALARPAPAAHQPATPVAASVAQTDRIAGTGRIGLFG